MSESLDNIIVSEQKGLLSIAMNKPEKRNALDKMMIEELSDALDNQTITIRRLGVKVADLTEIKGQRDITNYF